MFLLASFVVVCCIRISSSDGCFNEPLVGVGGVEMYAEHKQTFQCGFADFNDTAVFIVQTHYDDSHSSLEINGDYTIYGGVKVCDSEVVLNGSLICQCGGSIEFARNAQTVVESNILVAENSSIKFGQLMLRESSNVIISTGLDSSLWFNVLDMAYSNFTLVNNRPYPNSQIIYGKFQLINSSATFSGPISYLVADKLTALNSSVFISSDVLNWHSKSIELTDSSLELNGSFITHQGDSVINLARSEIIVNPQTNFFVSKFDIILSDSLISIDGQFFLSDYSLEGKSVISGRSVVVTVNSGSQLQIGGRYISWNLQSMDITLLEGSKLSISNYNIFNTNQGFIFLAKWSSLVLDAVNTSSCELIGNITVPENATYTMQNVSDSFNCTYQYLITHLVQSNKEYQSNEAKPSQIGATMDKDVSKCPPFYHSTTTETTLTIPTIPTITSTESTTTTPTTTTTSTSLTPSSTSVEIITTKPTTTTTSTVTTPNLPTTATPSSIPFSTTASLTTAYANSTPFDKTSTTASKTATTQTTNMTTNGTSETTAPLSSLTSTTSVTSGSHRTMQGAKIICLLSVFFTFCAYHAAR